ncbi:MAG: hypothetical protein COA97_03220 [Flavobacteriales bacterium]|nr:MAG: hypothetical protein COA97_03220 [Flavobacteriales bacterium]
MKKKIVLGLLIIVVILQFFRIDKTNPEINRIDDFIEINNPPQEIVNILKSACYDCHSHETKYPWYSNVAPISWWVKDHITEAREELNFSEWGAYKYKRKDHKLEEMIEMLEEGKMPLNEYTWTHADAKLTPEQKIQLINWIKETRTLGKIKKWNNGLHLNNGKKWKANEETTASINRMFEIAKIDVEEGRLSHYAAMGERLNIEVEILFKDCTMKGEEHNQLHLYIVPLIDKFGSLEFVSNEDEAMILQKDILKDLNNYHNYFE